MPQIFSEGKWNEETEVQSTPAIPWLQHNLIFKPCEISKGIKRHTFAQDCDS